MTTLLKNARVVTPHRVFDGYVLVSDGVIAEVGRGEPPPSLPGADIIDAGGRYLAPGFIDLHVHGGGGADFMDGSREAILTAAGTHLCHGTTAMLPTTLSAAPEELARNLELLSGVAAEKPAGIPEFCGIHLEGPYYALGQTGAQDPRYQKMPDPEEYRRLVRAFPLIRVWTIAPELPGALAMGRWLEEQGIIASIGHSDAVFDEVAAAVDNGYTMITHLYNAMSRLVRRDARMYLGVAESGLYFDELVAEVIADGHHLPPELLRLVWRAKGTQGICLVTDAIRAAGQDVSESILGSLADGQRVEIDGGVAYMPGRNSFGGSIATADQLVRTMVHKAGVSLPDAVSMMTAVPARMLGLSGRLGVVAPGADADLLLFDESINIHLVLAKGQVRHRAGA